MIIEFLTFSLFTLIVQYQSALQLFFEKSVFIFSCFFRECYPLQSPRFYVFHHFFFQCVLHVLSANFQTSSIFIVFSYKPDFSLTSSFLIVSLKFVCVCFAYTSRIASQILMCFFLHQKQHKRREQHKVRLFFFFNISRQTEHHQNQPIKSSHFYPQQICGEKS